MSVPITNPSHLHFHESFLADTCVTFRRFAPHASQLQREREDHSRHLEGPHVVPRHPPPRRRPRRLCRPPPAPPGTAEGLQGHPAAPPQMHHTRSRRSRTRRCWQGQGRGCGLSPKQSAGRRGRGRDGGRRRLRTHRAGDRPIRCHSRAAGQSGLTASRASGGGGLSFNLKAASLTSLTSSLYRAMRELKSCDD